jgi:tetratricopeptide (TPR) repeat protein
MAETWSRAFGRYLRTLRQRRGLSLQEVCSLSRAFAESLDKSYLSRCENGHQSPSFSKIIPLSRIYDVPADVLLERLELDMELERVGSPDTEGMTFAELTKSGRDALDKGHRWNAYAFLRDAVERAATDPVRTAFHDVDEQVVCAHMSCGTGALAVGRCKFALHEYLYVRDSGSLSARFSPMVLERLSQVYRQLGRHDFARENAEKAVLEAEDNNEKKYLGFYYSNRASQALAERDLEIAASFFGKAYRSFRNVNQEHACAKSLNNLAQTFFDLGRYRAARRSLAAADRLLSQWKHHRSRALGHILLGEIELLEHNETRAEHHWKQAAELAKSLNDKVLRFKAEYLLLKQAHTKGRGDVARSIHRRLQRLANWVPDGTPELKAFRDLEHDIAVVSVVG